MNPRHFLLALFLSVAAFAPQIARAQYGLSSSSSSNANGYYSSGRPVSDPESDSHTEIVGPVSSYVSSFAGGLYEEGSGGASSTVNYDSIHAEAGGFGDGGHGNGSNTSRWFDTVTVTSPTLAAGSSVILTATASYSGMASAYSGESYAGTPVTQADGQFTVMFLSAIGNVSLPYTKSLDVPFSGFGGSLGGRSGSLIINQTLQQTFTTYVGATLALNSEVDLSASGYGNGAKVSGQSNGSVDSVFDIQAQTAGVTLTRASGFVSVPEPSAFVTVLLGAGILGMVSRRRYEGKI